MNRAKENNCGTRLCAEAEHGRYSIVQDPLANYSKVAIKVANCVIPHYKEVLSKYNVVVVLPLRDNAKDGFGPA